MFVDAYLPGTPLIVGDLATFSRQMMQMLLKFVEDNPEVSCYSSVDVADPVLLSRFPEIVKEPLSLKAGSDDDAWDQALHDYANAVVLQGSVRTDVKLRMPLMSRNVERLVKLL